MLKPLTVLYIRTPFALEVHYLNAVTLTADKVDFAADDIVRSDKAYINLGLLYKVHK